MKHWVLFLLWLPLFPVWGQEPREVPFQERYREDQFYLGITYNALLKFPEGASQNGLSYGLQGGVIRDIPLNQACTIALGVGLGYAFNSYYSNLRALEGPEGIEYEILEVRDSYRRNKLETHLIEVPVEFRWRNSTRTSYKFWRVYGGVKFAYVAGSRSKYVTDEFTDSFSNSDTQNVTYGLTLNLGYNTFNLHLYYGLNSLFEDGVNGPDGQQLEMAPLRLGLIFYIL
jgi:hypothetical protein